jgi:hypothetical protein
VDDLPTDQQEGGSLVKIDAVIGYIRSYLQRERTEAYFQLPLIIHPHPSSAILLSPALAPKYPIPIASGISTAPYSRPACPQCPNCSPCSIVLAVSAFPPSRADGTPCRQSDCCLRHLYLTHVDHDQSGPYCLPEREEGDTIETIVGCVWGEVQSMRWVTPSVRCLQRNSMPCLSIFWSAALVAWY